MKTTVEQFAEEVLSSRFKWNASDVDRAAVTKLIHERVSMVTTICGTGSCRIVNGVLTLEIPDGEVERVKKETEQIIQRVADETKYVRHYPVC